MVGQTEKTEKSLLCVDHEFKYEEERFLHYYTLYISNKTQNRWICNQYPVTHKMTLSLGDLVEGVSSCNSN